MSDSANPYNTIVDWLFATASKQPSEVAFREWGADERDLTYLSLTQAIEQQCAVLKAKGIKKGEKVIIFTTPNVDLAITLFALFKIGAVAVVIDPAVGILTCLRCLANVRAQAMICPALIKWLLPLLRHYFSTVKRVVTTNELSQTNPGEAHNNTTNDATPGQSDLAAIFFTSGSTDLPKPVEWTHKQLKAHVLAAAEKFDIRQQVDLALFPLSMLISPVWGIQCNVPDFKRVRPSGCDAPYLVSLFEKSAATLCFASPAVWYQLTQYCTEQKIQLPNVQYAISGGAPIAIKAAKKIESILPNGKLFSPYGATEASPIAFSDSIEFSPMLGVKLGKPVSALSVKLAPVPDIGLHNLVSKDQNTPPVRAHSIGEIVLSGDMVSEHYHLAPELDQLSKHITEEADGQKVWHHTGDVAVKDEQGNLWSLGRAKDIIHLNGQAYFSTVAEEHVLQISYIDKAGYVFLAGITQAPVMFVQISKSAMKPSAPTVDDIKEQVARQLSEIDYPVEQVFIVAKMPVDKRHYSKIDRVALRNQIKKIHKKSKGGLKDV